ncbi:MAG: hypothetical protein NTW13_01985 [Candidatus Omnitrophica bacterium]|nr:hypothetical protein [Candidatus Omnitrophota bacterium]
MDLYFLNYADDRLNYKGGLFRKNQVYLNECARKQGIKNIISLTSDDLIKTQFYKEHKDYLDKPVYENGHVFKPYIILDTLKKIHLGDIVFYYDCGSYSINLPVKPIIALCKRNKGIVFHQWGECNAKWTKRDAFVYMNCDTPKFHNAVALQATWLFIMKTPFNLKLVEEWLYYNLDERVASYVNPDTCGLPTLSGFVQNRGDQSILSNLAVKYNIRTFWGAGNGCNKEIDRFTFAISPPLRIKIRNYYYKAKHCLATLPLIGKVGKRIKQYLLG